MMYIPIQICTWIDLSCSGSWCISIQIHRPYCNLPKCLPEVIFGKVPCRFCRRPRPPDPANPSAQAKPVAAGTTHASETQKLQYSSWALTGRENQYDFFWGRVAPYYKQLRHWVALSSFFLPTNRRRPVASTYLPKLSP